MSENGIDMQYQNFSESSIFYLDVWCAQNPLLLVFDVFEENQTVAYFKILEVFRVINYLSKEGIFTESSFYALVNVQCQFSRVYDLC